MTIGEIARLAGVSPSSVSNYFNRPDRVGAATAARIRTAVNQAGYAPNPHRPGPKTGERIGVRTGRILLLLAGVSSPRAFFDRPWGTPFLEGIIEGLRSRNLALQLAFAETPEELPAAIVRRECDGVIVFGSFWRAEEEVAAQSLLASLPVVRCSLHAEAENHDPWQLACDNRAAGILAADFLRLQGHHDVAVFNPEGGVAAYAERASAFRRAVRAYGLRGVEFAIPASRRIPAPFHPARYQLLADAYRKSPARPTGIFFCSDDCMTGVVLRLLGSSREIDLRHAIGCGGDERILAEFELRPSTIVMPMAELGLRAVASLLARIRGEVPLEALPPLSPELRRGRFAEVR